MKNKLYLLFAILILLCTGQALCQRVVGWPLGGSITDVNIKSAINALSPSGGTVDIDSTYSPGLGGESFPVCITVPNLTIKGKSGLGSETVPGDLSHKIFVITAPNCSILDLQFINAGGGDGNCGSTFGNAGAINVLSVTTGSTLIQGCTFNNNNMASISLGAGICIESSINVNVNGCVFVYNTANSNGGGIYAFESHEVSILNCYFLGNVATTNVGGGVSVISCSNSPSYPYDVHIQFCHFYENVSAFDGGAISWMQSDGVIDQNTIGQAGGGNISKYGGGISVLNCTTPSLTLIENNDILYNQANGGTPCPTSGGWGGGIFIEKCDDTVRVQSNNEVSSNTATYLGGGIAINSFHDPCSPWIIGNNITWNTVTNPCSWGYPNGGGGIAVLHDYSYPSQSFHPLIKQNKIKWNQVPASTSYGGGIFCLFSAPMIEQNDISENTAYDVGGGISLWEAYGQPNQGDIIDNLISNNYADAEGGGIDIQKSGPLFFDRNTVDDNTAGTGYGLGGGLYMMDTDLTARSNIFTRNLAALTTGTALVVDVFCTLDFYNNTVADNDIIAPYGEAMALASGANLANNIFSGHPNIHAIKEYSDQTVTCTNNLFWNNAHVYDDGALGERNVAQLNAIPGNSGNLSGDPLLDPSYHLSSSLSAAFDAGVDLTAFGVTFDIDKESRPMNTAFEIGADEYLHTSTVKDWYLY